MRGDQFDLVLREARLLIDNIFDEAVDSNDAGICRLPFVSDSPIPDENNQCPDPIVDIAIPLDHPPHVSCVPHCLVQAILFFGLAIDEQSLAIPKCDLPPAASEFGLDHKNPRGTDHDVINVKTIPNQIVKGVISIWTQVIQDLCNAHFAALTANQPPRFRYQPQVDDRRHPSDDDCKPQPKIQGQERLIVDL